MCMYLLQPAPRAEVKSVGEGSAASVCVCVSIQIDYRCTVAVSSIKFRTLILDPPWCTHPFGGQAVAASNYYLGHIQYRTATRMVPEHVSFAMC